MSGYIARTDADYLKTLLSEYQSGEGKKGYPTFIVGKLFLHHRLRRMIVVDYQECVKGALLRFAGTLDTPLVTNWVSSMESMWQHATLSLSLH